MPEVADLYHSVRGRRQTVLDARGYQHSIRFDGSERHAEIERFRDSLMRQLNKSSRTTEAESAQCQIMTTEVWSTQRQRPPNVAVEHSQVVDVGQLIITGTGCVCIGGSDG